MVLPWGAISRQHAKIYHDAQLGWIIEEKGSTSGTWICPKTGSQILSQVNSYPVQVRDNMVIKTGTYLFQFFDSN